MPNTDRLPAPTSRTSITLGLLLLLSGSARSTAQPSSCASPTYPADGPPPSLWGSFQPVTILSDATNYTGNERSDRRPQVTSVDVEGAWLAASYYHGLRLYDLTNPNAPAFVYGNNGYNGDWPAWIPGASEIDQFVYAAEWAPGDSTFLATGGLSPVGFAIWDTTSKTAPIPRYQDAGDMFVQQIFTARLSGRTYAFAADSQSGVAVYDLSRARELNFVRCIDRDESSTRLCPGVYVTTFGAGSTYIAGLVVGSKTFIARSGGAPSSVELWDVTTPASPRLQVGTLAGTHAFGVALWTAASRHYLATVVPLRAGPVSAWSDQLRIYDVTTCLTGSCSSISAPIADVALPAHADADSWKPLVVQFVGSKPILFFGHHDLCHDDDTAGQRHYEHYWDLTNPAAPAEITSQNQVIDQGQPVDYWTWYYSSSTRGEAWTSPLDAAWYGSYLIRADRSILDVHLWTPAPTPPVANFTWLPVGIYPGDSVQFTDASTGVVTRRAWTFSGATPPTSTAAAPVVTWSTSGTRNVSLTVGNGAGSNAKTSSVTVLSPVPAISAVSITPSPALVGETVTFQTAVTGQPPLAYSWAISGVASPLSGNPALWSTAGQAAGTRTITLTVSNASGARTTTRTLDLSAGLVRSWVASCPNNICLFEAPAVVVFATDVAGSVTQYAYDWDGNGSWDQVSPLPANAHSYLSPGSFIPRLRVTAGAATTTYVHQRTITLLTGTSALSIAGPASLAVGQAGAFTASAVGCSPSPAGWLWLLDGGSGSSTTASLSASWLTAGVKTLQVATSACGSALGTASVSVLAPLFNDSFETGSAAAWSADHP